jgi:hypothetical protein
MRLFYLIFIIIGFGLTSYGFWVVVNETQNEKKAVWKPICLLIGIMVMVFGLLLYGVPNFFSSH